MSARLIFVATLLASACGSSPSREQPDAAMPNAHDSRDYCETVAGFFCDFYLRCGRIAAADTAECRAVFVETCNARFEPRYLDLVAAGLLSLSADGIAACAAHLATVDCAAQVLDLDGPCAGIWRGTQPAGAPCGTDVESFVCAAGTTCVLDLSLCGSCEATAPVGGDCSGALRCEPDAYCDGAACRARPRAGQACANDVPCTVGARCENNRCESPSYVGVGGSCDASHRCAYRSRCVGGVCAEEALLGQPCGAGCTSGRCVDGTCVALAATGEACQRAADCASAVCGADGRCAALPDACIRP